MQKSVRITGACCVVLAMLALLPAVPLQCFRPAVLIAAVSLAAGVGLGLCMAGITRSRRPIVIYLLVLAAAATLWPLYHGWPSAYQWEVLDYGGPVNRVITYLEALRPIIYLVAVPFPYGWLGQHSADPIPLPVEPAHDGYAPEPPYSEDANLS